MTRTFASDNWAGVHPQVLDAIARANDGGHAPAYGADPWTEQAERLFRDHFGPEAEIYFAFNGTGTNVVGLQSLLRPHEAVVCADSAHINVDECGAPERFLGSKLLGVPTPDGKLNPDLVAAAVTGVGDEHHVQARVVSITQSTEVGTVYTVDEIAGLAEWAHAHSLYLHLDGARIANAAASLDVDLGAFGREAGVDVVSFGGTKNGALGAEAVITFRNESETGLRFIRKQSMQLSSKMRFVAAQFVALLTDGLWRTSAEHANTMARRLGAGVSAVPGVRLAYPVQANGVFAVVPPAVTAALQTEFPFYVWDPDADVVRLMASFDTTEDDVDRFVGRLAELMGRHV
ncbi:MAG: low specificity L-threonine aldolase [Acidimicrobiales bacterium]